MGPLVPASWLASNATDVIIFDASYYLPNEGKDAAALFAAGHVPGARFFDIDAIADHASGLPHMLPSPVEFGRMAGALGVTNDSRIVVYDQRGIFSAARVWWMFRVFGHDNVAVLDGGLPAWTASGGALEAGARPAPPAGSFTATYRAAMVRSLKDMRGNLTSGQEMVVDARAAGRFDGTVPEPRVGMRSGHIPNSTSLPFGDVLEHGKMRSAAQLRVRFAQAGVDGSRSVVASCGSGVTAAVLSLAMVVAGLPEAAIYDGSWSEWGSLSDTPIEV